MASSPSMGLERFSCERGESMSAVGASQNRGELTVCWSSGFWAHTSDEVSRLSDL